mmetsp:Transcript_12721/g.12521  ORF Transcript_12721/g.12521 Transcript_12721/m.12521 type:complete len:224 (-) Transcript_12721:30-701(-)
MAKALARRPRCPCRFFFFRGTNPSIPAGPYLSYLPPLLAAIPSSSIMSSSPSSSSPPPPPRVQNKDDSLSTIPCNPPLLSCIRFLSSAFLFLFLFFLERLLLTTIASSPKGFILPFRCSNFIHHRRYSVTFSFHSSNTLENRLCVNMDSTMIFCGSSCVRGKGISIGAAVASSFLLLLFFCFVYSFFLFLVLLLCLVLFVIAASFPSSVFAIVVDDTSLSPSC